MKRYSAAVRRWNLPGVFGPKQRRRIIALVLVTIVLLAYYSSLWPLLKGLNAGPPRANDPSHSTPSLQAQPTTPTPKPRAPQSLPVASSLHVAARAALQSHYLGYPEGVDRRDALLSRWEWSGALDMAAASLQIAKAPQPNTPSGHSPDYFVVVCPVVGNPSDRAVLGDSVLLVVGRPGDQSARCRQSSSPATAAAMFTNDAPLRELVMSTFGADWFEATVVFHPTSGNTMSGPMVSVMFVYDPIRCLYVASQLVPLPTDRSISWTAAVLVDHMHEGWNAFRETQTEAHYNYVLRRVAGLSVAASHDGGAGPMPLRWDSALGGGAWVLSIPPIASESVGAVKAFPLVQKTGRSAVRWVSTGKDPIEAYHTSQLKGYWLTYKTMRWEAYQHVPNYQYDFLGRMNFGGKYTWRGGESEEAFPHESGGAVVGGEGGEQREGSPPIPSANRDDILQLLRHRVVYFFGDSHMRIFFYGFLTRIGVSYPLDKVWRGDRTDYIPSHNVTVKFIASYFLNFSRPSAAEMMMDASVPIVIAGVGQHHSCHCWSVDKHMSVVREALADLTNTAGGSPIGAWRRQRRVVWFGIPAQPYNTHLYRAKPVGQARRDCRNNARHALYSAYHVAALSQHHQRQREPAAGVTESANPVVFLDAFYSSFGQQHTSLDGAHYYTWVREAWIDQLVAAVRRFG